MMAVFFSSLMRFCMKVLGMSIVATSLYSSASMMNVSSTDAVATVGKIASSLYINYLCLFPSDTSLPFRVTYIFSLREKLDYSIVFLYSLVKFFLCRGMNVSLIWSCFIYDWTSCLPFLSHLLRPALSEI